MRHQTTILILILLFASSSYAQLERNSRLFWNNYSIVNPAFSGLTNKQFATLHYLGQNEDLNGNGFYFPIAHNAIWAIYDRKVNGLHGAVGLSYNHKDEKLYWQDFPNGNIPFMFFTLDEVKLNYNVQFQFAKERALSLGISVSYERFSSKVYEEWIVQVGPFYDGSLNPMDSKSNDVHVGLGIAYKGPNFLVGLSTTRFNEPHESFDYYSFENYNRRIYHFLIAQKFNILKNSAKLTINPSISYNTAFNDYYREDITLNLRLIFFDTFWLGASLTSYDTEVLMIGFRAFRKFELQYAYETNVENNDFYGQTNLSHEFAFSYYIK